MLFKPNYHDRRTATLFLRRETCLHKGFRVAKVSLYRRYLEWAREEGFEDYHLLSSNQFCRAVRNEMPRIGDAVFPKDIALEGRLHSRPTVWVGLRLVWPRKDDPFELMYEGAPAHLYDHRRFPMPTKSSEQKARAQRPS